MSGSTKSYWKTLNNMLQSDELEFNQTVSAIADSSRLLLVFKDVKWLKKGVQYALENPKEVSTLEYECNNNQPIKITERHLDVVREFVENRIKPVDVAFEGWPIDACCGVPISEFLLDCFLLAQCNISEFQIISDSKRKSLISTLFGNNFETLPLPKEIKDREIHSCTQIVFESADFESAIDELLVNLSDRTLASWRIQSVYVHESLKNAFLETLTMERLNALDNMTGDNSTEDYKCKNAELAKRFGGKFVCSDNANICLMFDVPPKYLSKLTRKAFHQIPVAIGFFRTTKEAIQLVNASHREISYASIWTENIGLLYEVAVDVNADIVWSNSVGLFDEFMPCPTNVIPSDHKFRYKKIKSYILFSLLKFLI